MILALFWDEVRPSCRQGADPAFLRSAVPTTVDRHMPARKITNAPPHALRRTDHVKRA